MSNPIRAVFFSTFLLTGLSLLAQDKPNFKYGKVSPDDFSVKVPDTDSGAHAIIIGDIGRSVITPNSHGGFGYEFERRLRVKILDINGVDAGKFEIPVYSSKSNDSKEDVKQLKAYTYNLEGGKVIETKLENNQVFTEKISKTRQNKKFSLPALKAGSIFEISYTISSDFIFDFRPWQFQHEYPCLWSEYETEIPEYFDYVILSQGYLPYTSTKKRSENRSFKISNNRTAESVRDNTFNIDGIVNISRWVIKDVPSLKEESYTTSLQNHLSKIEFQLSSIKYPQQTIQMVMESWEKVTKDFMEHESFGAQLDKANNWLDDDIKSIVGNAKDPVEKSKLLYAYVRDNFTCTQRSGLYTSANLKDIWKVKRGNVADINLMLTALLMHEKIECYPIILSTRSHGITNPIYPLLDRFNYVICVALVGNNEFLLDASVPFMAFGKLDRSSYNGHARVLTKNPIPIELSADSVVEKSMTMAIVIPEDDKFVGKVTHTPGYYEALVDRTLIKDKGESDFFGKIKSAMGSDFTVSKTEIESLAAAEEPLKISYEIAFKDTGEDVIYFTPVLNPFYTENPFSAAVRRYPVEMPYLIDRVFILNMKLPPGYSVDEMPKPVKVKLNDEEGFFEYLINYNDGSIQLRTRMVLAKANFNPDDYDSLRDFFSYVIKKQAEQVILKKK